MRKRSHPDGDAALPMLRFKRPHNSAVSSLCMEPSIFKLNVLICRPQFGNYHHWAIQLHNLATDDGTIFEVQGAHPSYEFASYQCRRNFYELKVLKCIRIGEFTLSSSALASISHAIEHQVEVRNDITEWNCQDYVIETLDMLEEEWWLDIDDKEYTDVKRKLKAMYGSIELVQKAVNLYPQSLTSESSSDEVAEKMDTEPKNVRSVQFVFDSEVE